MGVSHADDYHLNAHRIFNHMSDKSASIPRVSASIEMDEEFIKQRIFEYTKAISMCEDKRDQQILKDVLKDGLIRMQDKLLNLQSK